MPPVTYLNTLDAWQHAATELSREPRIAVDLEANSLYAYRERICLVQISSPTRDYILDPLAGFSFPELGTLLADSAIEKVFHASEYDMLLLHREFQFEVRNLFDTMWAARILGYTHMGLAGFLEEHFGVVLSKKHQKANWGARPLSEDMLEYAQADTHYLLRLRDIFAARIEETGRVKEAAEIFANACKVRAQERLFDPDSFWKIKGVRELRPKALPIFKALVEFREEEARRRDLPPFKILPNHVLLECAEHAPADMRTMQKVPGLSPKIVERYGERLLRVVAASKNAPVPKPPQRGAKTDPDVLARFDKLFQWRKELALTRGVESDVILPKHTLWEIAHANPGNLSELEAIKGFGPQRLELYGSLILTQIQEA
jgi:ribonuclease D